MSTVKWARFLGPPSLVLALLGYAEADERERGLVAGSGPALHSAEEWSARAGASVTASAPRVNKANDKRVAIPTWENVALAVPPNKAHCGPEGAVLFSVGQTPRIWRSSLACFAGNESQCLPNSDVAYGSSGWPLVTSPGVLDRDNGTGQCGGSCGPAGSNDSQLLRLSGGDLLLIHQGVRRDDNPTTLGLACTSAGSTCRGVEYVFRSTDCGTSWSHVVTLDPAFIDGGRYYNTTTQGGFDRPEVYVDPFNGDRVYMTLNGVGNTDRAVVLFSSQDGGKRWQLIGKIVDLSGVRQLTSLPSGRLYIFGSFDSDGQLPYDAVIYSYDPVRSAFSPQYMIPGSSEDVRSASVVTRMGADGISPVGSFSDGDYLRVHYSHLEDDGTSSLRVKIVRINARGIDLVAQMNIAPAGRSVIGATTINADRLEWARGTRTVPALVYWYEVAASGTTVRYSVFDGLGASEPDVLAYSSGKPVTWPSFVDNVGDYHKGAFWYDSRDGKLRFMPIWGEFWPNGEVHANVVTIDPACGGPTPCSCGETVVKPTVLTANLVCSSLAGPYALKLATGGTVDLNGKTIQCTDMIDGIVIEGNDLNVQNGVVRNCLVGVRANGFPSFVGVRGIRALQNQAGMHLLIEQSSVSNNRCEDNAKEGINITGNANIIEDNYCSSNGRGQSGQGHDGMAITGSNLIRHNTSTGNSGHGISVSGDGNEVIDNFSSTNGKDGLFVEGTKNTLAENQGRTNGGRGVFASGGGNISGPPVGTNYGNQNRTKPECQIDGVPLVSANKKRC